MRDFDAWCLADPFGAWMGISLFMIGLYCALLLIGDWFEGRRVRRWGRRWFE